MAVVHLRTEEIKLQGEDQNIAILAKSVTATIERNWSRRNNNSSFLTLPDHFLKRRCEKLTRLFVFFAMLVTAWYILISTYRLPWFLPKISSWLVKAFMGSHYDDWTGISFIVAAILWLLAGVVRLAEKK